MARAAWEQFEKEQPEELREADLTRDERWEDEPEGELEEGPEAVELLAARKQLMMRKEVLSAMEEEGGWQDVDTDKLPETLEEIRQMYQVMPPYHHNFRIVFRE